MVFDVQMVCPRCKKRELVKNVDVKKRICKNCGCSFNSHTGEIDVFEGLKED